MEKLMQVLGKFFRGIEIFLSIIHHLIWIFIGGMILFVFFYVLSIGPGKLMQQFLPTQLLQGASQLQGSASSTGNNSNDQSSTQNGSTITPSTQNQVQPSQQGGNTQLTNSEKQCAISVLGSTRVDQLITGGTPTSTEENKVMHCFPNGVHL